MFSLGVRNKARGFRVGFMWGAWRRDDVVL